MAYGIFYEFESVTQSQYDAVNAKLGIDSAGTVDWPAGLLVHSAGSTTGGGWVVAELWESKPDQEKFMAERLGAALAAVGVPAPSHFTEYETVTLFNG